MSSSRYVFLKAVQDDISEKTVPIWLNHTVVSFSKSISCTLLLRGRVVIRGGVGGSLVSTLAKSGYG